MKGIVVRFTGAKREVGVLKTELQKISQEENEHVTDSEQRVREKKNDTKSLKFKRDDKYRDFNETKPSVKTDMNNNTEMATPHRGEKLDHVKKNDAKLIKRNELEAKPWNKNWAKRLRQQEQQGKKSDSKWDSDSSDEESRRKHPNRRLQRERPDQEPPVKRVRRPGDRPRSVVTSVGRAEQEADRKQTEAAVAVASKLWGKVLDRKEVGEDAYIKEVYEAEDGSGTEEVVDYKGLLEEFVLRNLEEQRDGGKTLYELRVDQMMRAPDSGHLVKEFYIAPALVEVLFQKMAQDDTAVESINRVCAEKNWPKPEFVCKSAGKHGFVYSCILKGKEFTPSKPASNELLAQELAAVECLEWLGFHQRAALGVGETPLQQTYFH